MGLAIGADASRVWNGACDRLHPDHWPPAAWAIRDDSVYAAKSPLSGRLGRTRAAIRQRLHAVDGQADTIYPRYRLRAEALVDDRRDCSDVVFLPEHQARGRVMGRKGDRLFASRYTWDRGPSRVVRRSGCQPADGT